MSEIRGSNVVLTGASYGLGPLIAKRLVEEGANLVIAARSAPRLHAVADSLSTPSRRVTAIPTDLRDPSSRDALIEVAEAELGPIDILVNGASVHFGGRLHRRTPECIQDVLETGLNAPVLLTRKVLPGMLQRRRGHLVQIASMAGKVALPYLAPYAAAKHGLVGFTHSLQAELMGTGVHASCVCPGFTRGEGMWARIGRRAHPAFGVGRPERVANAVIRAIRHNRTEVIVNPLPVRPAVALWSLYPGLAAGLFRAMRVDSWLSGVADQLEVEM